MWEVGSFRDLGQPKHGFWIDEECCSYEGSSVYCVRVCKLLVCVLCSLLCVVCIKKVYAGT